jgi:predicted lipoprotein with Yx(FWY)xxD motif
MGFVAIVLVALAVYGGLYFSTRANAALHNVRPAAVARHTKSSTITLHAAKVGKYGTILVNQAGHALYVFAPDGAKKVNCNSSCQSYWPPFVGPAHGDAKAGAGVKQSLIGSDPNPATKGRIVTYNGWPLYTYLGDSAADEATGQDIDESGGYWWVMRASGKLVK